MMNASQAVRWTTGTTATGGMDLHLFSNTAPDVVMKEEPIHFV
jgi:hypothetical protein